MIRARERKKRKKKLFGELSSASAWCSETRKPRRGKNPSDDETRKPRGMEIPRGMPRALGASRVRFRVLIV